MALALTMALLLPGQAAAATYRDCDTSPSWYPGGTGNNATGMARMMRTVGRYDGIIADQVVRNLHSCSNPNTASTMGRSWALLTMQDSFFFLQLGYGLSDCPTGQTCSVPDNSRRWVYTPSAVSGGSLDDMTFSDFENPQLGTNYRLRMYSNSTTWFFCVRWAAAGSAYHCRFDTFGFSALEEAYWLFEVAGKNDQMGSSASGTLAARFTSMQYNRESDSAWYITTGDVGNCNAAAGGAGACDTELGEPALFSRHRANIHTDGVAPNDFSVFYSYSIDDL